jgi:hypothetical protein
MTTASRPAKLLPTGRLKTITLLASIAAVFLSACGKKEAPPPPPAAPAQAPAPTPAPAEPGDTRQPSRLTAYLYGKEQIGALYEAGRDWDKKLGLQQDCKGPYNIQPAALFLLKPIDFPEGKPHPVAGVWQHRYVFERCGKRMTYNAVFVARPDDKPELRPHVPGNTNASALLLSDTLTGASAAALLRLAKRARDCKQAELIDTRLTQPPRETKEAGKPAGHWEETWTFRGCGQDVEVPIAFTPDGKGGTRYAIKDGN